MKVLETVHFKLNEGVAETDFVAADKEVDAWVRQRPGFESRILARGEDGTWLDTVVWSDGQAANSAMDAFMKDLCDSTFLSAIDEKSVKISHMNIVS